MTSITEARIFLSSSGEVAKWRDFVDDLIDEATNGVRAGEWGRWLRPQLSTIRWEKVVSSKTRNKETNKQFVELAENSHLTLVILQSQLGVGTKQEIEAVLRKRDVQMAVIWIRPPKMEVDAKLKAFMRKHQDNQYWHTIESSTYRDVAAAAMRIITAVVTDLVRSLAARDREDFDEQR